MVVCSGWILQSCAQSQGDAVLLPDLPTGISSLPLMEPLEFMTQDFIQPDRLPDALMHTPYDFHLTAQGGKQPYSFSIIDGELPTGISFSTDGLFSGTPTQKQSTTCDILLMDKNGTQIIQSFTIRTVYTNPVIILTDTLPYGKLGKTYQAEIETNGGSGTYSYEVYIGELPPGVTLDSETGFFSSEAPINQAYQAVFSVKVSDTEDSQNYAIKQLMIEIAEPVDILTNKNLPPAIVNYPYSLIFQGNGGTGEYVWSTDSTLPDDMILSENGTLSYSSTTADQSFSFDITIRDAHIAGYQTQKNDFFLFTRYRDLIPFHNPPYDALKIVSTPPVQPNDKFQVFLLLRNTAAGTTGYPFSQKQQVSVYFYLSEDTTISKEDTLLSIDTSGNRIPSSALYELIPETTDKYAYRARLNGLAADTNRWIPGPSEGMIWLKIPTDISAGTYYIGYILDPQTMLEESDSSNNDLEEVVEVIISTGSIEEGNPNDTFEQALSNNIVGAPFPAIKRGNVHFYSDTSDFYYVTVTPETTYSFYLTDLITNADLYLYEDSSGITEAWSTQAGTVDEEIINYVAEDTELYIEVRKIFTFESIQDTNYTLEFIEGVDS